MGLPKGTNNGNVGKKGRSGRKSFYQEKADAQFLNDVFFGKLDKEEIKKQIASGKYAIKDVFISKAFSGNDKMIEILIKKLFPDKKEITGQDGGPVEINTSITDKIDKIYGE